MIRKATVLRMPMNENDDRRWRAVKVRDRDFDGRLVFAVQSTGIYCRPSCAARRPHRKNVVFYDTPGEAEYAGYRPCRRCRPDQRAARDPQVEIVSRVCDYIKAHPDGPITLEALSEEVGLSPYHLQRTFKRIMGISPRQYADSIRLGVFKQQVREGEDVTGALYEAGFGSSSRLYERAPIHLGMTSAVYRRGGAGVRIEFATVGCFLGRLLVAATERGICAIKLGDTDATLEAALREEFPAAGIEQNPHGLTEGIKALLDYLEGDRPMIDLPLDVKATAFQRQVWEALRAIPYGSTRSYAEVAKSLGRPTAARAVARACATNPTALAVPCHRVVREDGGLGGYRWGLERKRALLASESGNKKRATRARQVVSAGHFATNTSGC